MVAISIIIPAYNEEAFLAATLQAIFSQDYEHFEVLVVDNGSSDRTAEIARTFPVRLLHEKRQGTMWACECGRKQATGDIIVRMDADCLPPSDWLRRGVAHFARESWRALVRT